MLLLRRAGDAAPLLSDSTASTKRDGYKVFYCEMTLVIWCLSRCVGMPGQGTVFLHWQVRGGLGEAFGLCKGSSGHTGYLLLLAEDLSQLCSTEQSWGKRRNTISFILSQDLAIVCFHAFISQGNSSWRLSSQSESL